MKSKQKPGPKPGSPSPNPSGRPKGTTKPGAKIPVALKLRPELVAGVRALASQPPGATQNRIIEAAIEMHLDLFLPNWKESFVISIDN